MSKYSVTYWKCDRCGASESASNEADRLKREALPEGWNYGTVYERPGGDLCSSCSVEGKALEDRLKSEYDAWWGKVSV